MLCYYAECRILFTVMLHVIMLSAVMLSAVMLSVVMLSVVMLSVVAHKKLALETTLAYFPPLSAMKKKLQ